MSRAVVTGAAGMLGGRIAAQLRRLDWDVVGTDLRPGPHITAVDLGDTAAWPGLLAGADLVVHAAAVVGEVGDPRSFWAVNAGGTATVLAAAATAGVGRVVHISSIVVHGSDFPDGVDESAPVHPTGNPYTDTKIAAEHAALRAAAEGLPVTVVRPGDIYGPGSAQWTVRPVELMRQGRFALPEGGTGVLTPVFVDDVVSGVVAAATSPDAVGQVFHITGGRGVSTREYFGSYAAMLGVPLRVIPRAVGKALARPLDLLPRLGVEPPLSSRTLEYLTHPGTYSIAKAERVLGWSPAVSLQNGLEQTARWLRESGMLADPGQADR